VQPIRCEVKRAPGLKQPLLVGHSLGGALSLASRSSSDCAGAGGPLIAPLTQVQEDAPEPFRASSSTHP